MEPCQIEKPIPEPEIPPEHNIPSGFFIVPGVEGLYCHKHGALQIHCRKTIVTTSWKYNKKMAGLPCDKAVQEATRKYPDETTRSMFLRFVQAHQEGVMPIQECVVNSCQHEPTKVSVKQPVEEKQDISANIDSVDWSTVPAEVFGDIQYQECRSKVRLKQGNNICNTNWDTIVRLSSLPITKLHNEIATLFNSPDHREMICALIELHKTGVIKDPDYFARPMLFVNTQTNFDGGKVEMEEVY